MNNDKRFIGTFTTEEELFTKIREVKATGVSEDNIYVISKNDDNLQMVRNRTDAEIKTTSDSMLDKFKDFMTGDDHIHALFDDLNVSEAEKERYSEEVNNGKMVLYVDEGEVDTLHRDNSDRYGMNTRSTDPNLGANALNSEDRASSMTGSRTDKLKSTNEKDHLHGNYDHTADNNTKSVNATTPQHNDNLQRTTEHVPETMDLHEERLEVEKDVVKKGEVSLDKNVVEKEIHTDIPVEHEEVTIERRPVDSLSASHNEKDVNTDTAFDDETIRIPVTEEKVEVTKKPVVTEEIVINKKTVTDSQHVDEKLKREEVKIDRKGNTDDVDLKGNTNDRNNKMDDNNKNKF